jgi:hypothetical protein
MQWNHITHLDALRQSRSDAMTTVTKLQGAASDPPEAEPGLSPSPVRDRKASRTVQLRNVELDTQRGVGFFAIGLLALALIVSILMAVGASGAAGFKIGVGTTTFVVFAAAALVGASLGLLFGLPRSRSAASEAPTSTNDAAQQPGTSTAESPAPHFYSNLNLVKVSDWLTTIIIGLGLVNLGKLVPALASLGASLSTPLGGSQYAATVGIAISVTGSLAGFALTYLWASIQLRALLEKSARNLESKDQQ